MVLPMRSRATPTERDMPKKDPVEMLNAVSSFLIELGETMSHLSDGIRDEDEDEINECIESLPSKKEITKNLTLLGDILEKQPWRKKNA
jgi:hypothetical protein